MTIRPDLARISTERCDVAIDPVEGQKRIARADVEQTASIHLVALREAKRAEAIAEADENHGRTLDSR